MWRRPAPGREPAPRARLTPERPGLGDSPSKLLRFPMAVSCCGVAEGASPCLDEPGTIAKYVRRCDLGIIAPSRDSNLDTARLTEETLDGNMTGQALACITASVYCSVVRPTYPLRTIAARAALAIPPSQTGSLRLGSPN